MLAPTSSTLIVICRKLVIHIPHVPEIVLYTEYAENLHCLSKTNLVTHENSEPLDEVVKGFANTDELVPPDFEFILLLTTH